MGLFENKDHKEEEQIAKQLGVDEKTADDSLSDEQLDQVAGGQEIIVDGSIFMRSLKEYELRK
ncbi:MAG: hypothetical protein IKI65_06350 [Firmicutes bacterium]|nr:hypothetical protein [Bacillota bacterium]